MPEFDTLLSARDALASKKVSSVELTQRVLDRIAKSEGTVKAFVTTAPDRALEQAKAFDAGKVKGELAGIPIAIKDNFCTTWGTTTCSSKMLKNFHAPYNASVVEKLEAAGAVIVGKTNLDEFAMGSSTENSAFQTTRNPWNTDCIPGGSSGGAAAALAAGFCNASLGSDTGGSIRQPASLCGLVGLKPTYGRVSRYGLVAFASSLDQIGPFTWDVPDCALMMNVIAGHDDRDSTSAKIDVPDHLADLDKPLSGVRIGIAKEFDTSEGVDAEVNTAVHEAIAEYKKLGATLVDVSLPHTKYGIAAYYVIAPCEASSNLARYDGVHYGHRTAEPVKDIIELFSKSRYEGFGEEVQRRIMIGTYALSAGYGAKYYERALKIRTLISQDFTNAFQQCDVIISPTSPTVAFKPGDKIGDPLAMYLCDVFTVTCNIAGIAGLSMPCGLTKSAKPLPIGMQLLGPAFSEPKLLRIARMYEKATSWHTKRPA